MTTPDSRTRRPRTSVIDLRRVAADRRPDAAVAATAELLRAAAAEARHDPGGVRGLGTLPMGTRQTALVVDRALGDA